MATGGQIQRIESREEGQENEPVEPGRSCFRGSREDLLIIIAFCVSNFFVQVFYSLMAPFYPTEATYKKGVDHTLMGLIIGIYELALVVTSPILGKYINQIGAKFMFIAGHLVCGVCSVLFGALDFCPPGVSYVTLSFLIRILEGASGAGISTASFAIVGSRFPDRVATLFGTLEMFCGFGMMLGPLIGSGLYYLGGFGLPFAVCGVLLLIVGCICVFLIPSVDVGTNAVDREGNGPLAGNPDIPASVFGLLSVPLVAVTGFNVVMGSMAIGFMTATLEEQLQDVYHIHQQIIIGLVCFVGPFFYMILAPIWGSLADRFTQRPPLFVIIGYCMASIAFWFMGPAPFFNIKMSSPWLLITAQGVLGAGIAAFVVAFRIIANVATEKYSDSLATFGVVAGLFNSFFSFGAFLGPFLGGVVHQSLGFEWGTFLMGCLVLASALLLGVYKSVCWCAHLRPQVEDGTPQERRGLLPENVVGF